ncbi:MAG: NUDIX domain-containing protein [Candidatus Andeanibacterium colombiense]|uniref:NUDIX domain-containing protein n=1 Tax=Candidatus Andeanibacterium colombiense TaxID=3121345 RepID=A0AAJ5X9D2_9SPHN|nr:MAG: NUDIX domain-containing protein [Sphingomonadaceae bacterium]
MLHLIERLVPAPLHRAALRLAHRLRKLWWRTGVPRLAGVVVLARDPAGRVLLVRHSYGAGMWTLPGGGLHRGEDPARAAAREFAEELRCATGPLTLLEIHEGTLHGAPNRLHVFTCVTAETPAPDGREILEARFFAVDALPQNRGGRVALGLALLAAN